MPPLTVRRTNAIRALGNAGGVDGGAPPAAAAAGQGGGSLLISGLRILRESCVTLQLLGGGAACSDQLKVLEEVCRTRLRALGHQRSANPLSDPVEITEIVQLKRMTASEAISYLGSSDREHTERQQADHFHNVGFNADMVRHANVTNRVHDRARTYAVDKLTTKLDEVCCRTRARRPALRWQ